MTGPLPWHGSQWQRLMRGKAAGRLPHALLCVGPAGVGKRAFAEGLAQALLCAAPAADGFACGACRRCRLFAAGSHPDYVRVEPAERNKPIRVDQVRELGAFLGYTSRFGGYKIALLVPAERMNLNAANSLLKTLEEPPGESLLLLVTAAPSKLPATVRSRCQRLAFHVPPAEQAAAWLGAQASGIDPLALLNLAAGAPLEALACAQDGRLVRREALFRSYEAVTAGRADPVRAAELWLQGNVAENLRWLIGWHVDMIRLKMVATPPWLQNPDLRAALRHRAGSLPAQTLFRRLDAAVRLHDLCATQVNAQLMIEAFLGECAGESR